MKVTQTAEAPIITYAIDVEGRKAPAMGTSEPYFISKLNAFDVTVFHQASQHAYVSKVNRKTETYWELQGSRHTAINKGFWQNEEDWQE